MCIYLKKIIYSKSRLCNNTLVGIHIPKYKNKIHVKYNLCNSSTLSLEVETCYPKYFI